MLSVIIPAYNERGNIQQTLKHLEQSLDKLRHPYELIVVCDGCTDDTAEQARALKLPHARVLEYEKNHGKGYALTFGANASKGEKVTFIDAGGDFDAGAIDKFSQLMDLFDADIVIGSKRHPASIVSYPLRRRIGSRLYQYLIRLLFNLNLRDTQTGLKLFHRDVLLKVLPRAVVKRYAFDLELLVIARHLGFRRIFEAPVTMHFNESTTSLGRNAIMNALQDTFAIWYRLQILHYYDRAHVRVSGKQ